MDALKDTIKIVCAHRGCQTMQDRIIEAFSKDEPTDEEKRAEKTALWLRRRKLLKTYATQKHTRKEWESVPDAVPFRDTLHLINCTIQAWGGE